MKRLKAVVLSDFLNDLPLCAFITYSYWYIYLQTKNQNIVSFLGTVATVGMLLAIVGGYISDQYSKVKLMKRIIVLRFIIIIIASTLITFFKFSSVYLICGIITLNSILNIVYNPLTEAIAPALVENNDLLIKANSWVSLANNIATIVSSGVAAIFVALRKPTFAIYILLLSVLCSLIALGFVKNDKVPIYSKNITIKKICSRFVHGFKLVLKNKLIVSMIPIALIVNFCFYIIWLLMPNMAVNNFGKYEFMYNGIDIAYTLGGIIGAFIFSHIKNNLKSQILCPACLTFQALSLVIVGIASLESSNIVSAYFCLLCWLLYGLFNSIFSIVYFSIVQMSASKDQTGMMIGSVMTIFSVVNPIATSLSAPLSQLFVLPVLIIILGIIMSVVSALTFLPIYQRIFKGYDKVYNG